MSVLPLDGVLAGSYACEVATGGHSAEVFSIVAAEMTDAFGFCPDTEEDMRADLMPPDTTQAMQVLVRDRSDGAPVQWWAVLRDQGDPIFHAWVRSHPRLPDSASDDLASAGFATMLDWIRDNTQEGQPEVRVQSGCPAGGSSGHRHLEAAGFEHQRTFWEMVGQVNAINLAADAVAGLTIAPSRDERVMHRILDDAFEGHYGYSALSFDDWLAVEKSLSGHDPSLWVLAELEGTPAAVLAMSRRLETEGMLYVQELATVDGYRRRGIASALLAHAFKVAEAMSFDRVSLHVDSENSDDAPSVYRRAGFEVRCAFHAFARNLTL